MFAPAAKAAPNAGGNTPSWCLIAKTSWCLIANVISLNLLTIFGQVLNKTRRRLPSCYMDLHFLEKSEPVHTLQKSTFEPAGRKRVRFWAQRIINQALQVRPRFT